MGLFFAVVTALVTVAVSVGTTDSSDLPLRLGLLAVILPAAMAWLARHIVGPATALETAALQFRTLYSQARIDALLDPISGLGNHRAFQEELHRRIEDAGRHGYPVALAIVDLDDLKRINDAYGHAGGDRVLASMGRLLLSSSRVGDRSFRIGGDEFAVLLPHATAADAHGVIRRFLATALSGDSTFGAPFSFSAGVAGYPDPCAGSHGLLRGADAALYWAKRHGRTDVQVYEPGRHGNADETRSVAEMGEAVDSVTTNRAMAPVFQPIFDLESGQAIGFEGLVRPSADAGFRNAGALFTAAEVAHRTVELDMAAIATIVDGLGGGPDAASDWYLSVNLSPRTLETDQFRVSDLLAAFEGSPLTPDRLVLELTEREAVGDMHRMRANLEACQAAGFRIAADDVGAGNAGLRLLSEIRFDLVKIDLSLVQGGVLRDAALSVLGAIQELAARSGTKVVAEGIETTEQLDVIRRLGISAGQGYLLAMPAPHVELQSLDIDALLASHQARREALLGHWDDVVDSGGTGPDLASLGA
jgi:diguanylate cyclase (GGDEF)-like protein